MNHMFWIFIVIALVYVVATWWFDTRE